MKNTLLIIDMQNDFCHPDGTLYVPGAENDVNSAADFLSNMGPDIHEVVFTLDTHTLLDIAHPAFWKDAAGNNPDPFTMIKDSDIEDGVWIPTLQTHKEYAIYYTKTLAENGKYPLVIWPPHCLIGSWGHNIPTKLMNALERWQLETNTNVKFVRKGENPLTEHYSAIVADVQLPDDHNTLPNLELVEQLRKADTVYVAGEATSHCVSTTVRDMIEFDDKQIIVNKIKLLTDTMSSVPGFEHFEEEFYHDMEKLGVPLISTQEV